MGSIDELMWMASSSIANKEAGTAKEEEMSVADVSCYDCNYVNSSLTAEFVKRYLNDYNFVRSDVDIADDMVLADMESKDHVNQMSAGVLCSTNSEWHKVVSQHVSGATDAVTFMLMLDDLFHEERDSDDERYEEVSNICLNFYSEISNVLMECNFDATRLDYLKLVKQWFYIMCRFMRATTGSTYKFCMQCAIILSWMIKTVIYGRKTVLVDIGLYTNIDRSVLYLGYSYILFD